MIVQPSEPLQDDSAQDLEFQWIILHLSQGMDTCSCEFCVRVSGRLKFRAQWYVEAAS